MKTTIRSIILSMIALLLVAPTWAQDWPQWRGVNRDGIAKGFKAPAKWPEKMTKKWSVDVGDGVATPSLVGDKLFVFARQGGDEVMRCLDLATGKELWKDKYEAAGVRPPAQDFQGPRASPAVADGKVLTLGVHGTVTCFDAASGKVLWRKNDYPRSEPRFGTSSSPVILKGVGIVQLGGDNGGAMVGYEMATGEHKWKWDGDGASYASPVLMTYEGKTAIVAPTAYNLVIVNAADGKLLWKGGYAQGRYNATTPLVTGQTVIYAGETRGTTAEKFFTKDDKVTSEIVWRNSDNSLIYNSPVMKDGVLYGLSNRDEIFCVSLDAGKTAWSAPMPSSGGGGRRGRRGQAGYGSIVDAGSALFALTPAGQLVVFAPDKKEYKQLASYKVAERGCYAYPLVAGNRVIIKDQNAVTLWTLE